jgi:hypothetical protein
MFKNSKKDLINVQYIVRFEVLMAASMKMAVFWVVAPRSLVQVYLILLWNVGKLLPDYTVQQPRRRPSLFNTLIDLSCTYKLFNEFCKTDV